ncbi:MAG: hypothetical protein NT123_02085 [Proteobacteria bacterium]|nr:hypothetical protein [Pseudomonadota bacterium]
MSFIISWLIELVVLWVICGVICAVAAANKGRSGFGWFVIGFLLGPLGIVLSLVVSKNQVAIDQAAIADGDLRKCPVCAELVKSEAILCKHCGKGLPEVALKLQNQSDESPSLHDAAWNGNYVTVSRLLKAGVDANLVNADGKSALELAPNRGDKQIVQLLLS